jgi:phosphatidylglycerophosphate synthase
MLINSHIIFKKEEDTKDAMQITSHLHMNSAYTIEEAKFLLPWQSIRQKLLHPFMRMFVLFRITPDTLSYGSVLFGLGFTLLASNNFTIAFWLLMLAIACDGLDGVLARYLGTASSSGSFTDAVCDQTVLALSIIGMIVKGVINPLLGVSFVFTYTTFMMLIILHALLKVPSHFIFRPSRNLFFITIGIYFFFGINVLNIFLALSLLTLPLVAVSFLRIKAKI